MLDANYIKNDVIRVMDLLAIGFLDVAPSKEAKEAVIMRSAHTLLEVLLRNVIKRAGVGE
jgi:hypothetical protein